MEYKLAWGNASIISKVTILQKGDRGEGRGGRDG